MTDEFRLPVRANIDTAQDVIALAMAAFPAEGEPARIALDASEVTALDGPTTLALASIAHHAAERGLKVSVKSPSSAFVDAFSDIGMFEDLMKMEFVS